MGLGLVIGLIEHLQIITTSNYSIITNSHALLGAVVSAYANSLSLCIALDSHGEKVLTREWWRMNVCELLQVTMDCHE